MDDFIARAAQQVLAGQDLDRGDACRLATIDDALRLDLFYWANRIRIHFVGPEVRCCSIVAAKVGACSEDCAFCSQSAHYKTPTEGLSTLRNDEVEQAARQAADSGADSFGIVNSGYGPTDAELETWAPTIRKIRDEGRIRACASLGILEPGQAERLRDAGLQRYNHNLQTSKRFFPNIIKTHSYEDRRDTLVRAKAAGLSLCSGALVGMGETWEDRIDLALELRDLDVDVVPLNFLHAIDGTPLERAEPMAPMECLHIIALYRFLLPDKEIKIAGGREVNLRDLQSWMFFAGANSFLIGNYLTTFGRSADEDRQMLADLGLRLADDSGSARMPEPAKAPSSFNHALPIAEAPAVPSIR